MKEIIKRVELTYGRVDDLVQLVQRRFPSDHPELLRKELAQFSFKRRGTRELEVTALQIEGVTGSCGEEYEKVMEVLRTRKLRPAGVWELLALVPLTWAGFDAKDVFRREFGEEPTLIGLGHHIKSWIGPTYPTVLPFRSGLDFSFELLLTRRNTYYVGYREVT